MRWSSRATTTAACALVAVLSGWKLPFRKPFLSPAEATAETAVRAHEPILWLSVKVDVRQST